MKKTAYIILTVLVIINIISWSFLFSTKDNLLKVIFFDVGQGDGIFIETLDKKQIVIDGGPDYNLMAEKISEELPFWDKEIDAIILTHTDSDHMNGLLGVLEKYKVDNILWTGVKKEGMEKKIENWENIVNKEVENNGAKVFLVKNTNTILTSNMSLNFLWPEKINEKINSNDSNDYSLASRLCYLKTCFLFMGDMSFNEEKNVIRDEDIKGDILKVAHHGSKYATSNEFISAVSPKLAIIEVGKNSYGHPALETIKRLEDYGAKVVRTDTQGDITVFSDGQDYKIVYEK
ncbi:MAG: MBL fold metallo-hydrolase [Candidatus Paceibacterota bacterium]|jgi:beta-lactamase superfamily II metal-dependent hydrolase|nr:MBL fold metallo-hydrolase [bacterium]